MAKKKSKQLEAMDSIDDLKKSLCKKHGKEILAGNHEEVDFVSTGLLGLDWQLGGGSPRGRIIEIYGPESSGKTSLASHIIGTYQKKGLKAAYIDVEHAFEPFFAENHKVKLDELLFSQPDSGEQALNLLEDLIDSNLMDIIVIDSVAALVPEAELNGEIGDSHVGLQARLMGQALRKLVGKIKKSKATVIFINQLRMKIGVMFGSPETTSGGNALKFYASVRIDVRRTGFINKECPTGIEQKIKIIKNKVGAPFREGSYRMLYKGGYDVLSDFINKCLDFGLLEKNGCWISYNGEKVGQGVDKAKEFFRQKENKELRTKLLKECKSILKEIDGGDE